MSLTFNQATQSLSKPISVNGINPSTFSFGMQSANIFGTINITNNFNNEFYVTYSDLDRIRQSYQHQVKYGLKFDPSLHSQTLRNHGVKLAWKYEQAEIRMGGEGTYNWSKSQRHELLESGKVKVEGSKQSMPGHHINNVKSSPELQSNPDNVQFTKDYKEHLNKYHNGNFKNDTKGELYNRNQRLKDANNKRVFKNELTGIGRAVAIGLGVGFTLGFVVTLAQSGISPENLKNAAIVSAKTAIEGAVLGVVNHLVVRGIGEMATNALQGVVGNLGLTITDNIVKMCNMAVFGGLAIVVFSVYQFTKLKLLGYNTKECLLRVGRSAAFSSTILLISIVSQGIWGGHVGIIVSISIGFIVLTYKVIDNQRNKRIGEQVRIYMIQKCEPLLTGV